MSPTACPLCRKLADLDALAEPEVVWRFPHSIAFLGTHQFYRGYCVLVARRHASELSGLADEVRRLYLDEMCLLARAIEQGFRPSKLNYELLGNQVPHLHWHLFPRSREDADHLKPVWLALDRAEQDADLRRRLEGDPLARPNVTTLLREQLTRLDAPKA
jgi:diadenosine tetraphosphate (Ap4A) HIT family hydrolase